MRNEFAFKDAQWPSTLEIVAECKLWQVSSLYDRITHMNGQTRALQNVDVDPLERRK